MNIKLTLENADFLHSLLSQITVKANDPGAENVIKMSKEIIQAIVMASTPVDGYLEPLSEGEVTGTG